MDEILNKLKEFGKLVVVESNPCGNKRSKTNPTLNVKYESLNDHISACEDCGQVATNRKVTFQKMCTGHVKETCSHCQMCRHPDTGVFDIPVKQFYNRSRFFKKKSWKQ